MFAAATPHVLLRCSASSCCILCLSDLTRRKHDVYCGYHRPVRAPVQKPGKFGVQLCTGTVLSPVCRTSVPSKIWYSVTTEAQGVHMPKTTESVQSNECRRTHQH
jgi:hypothetical protein